MKSQVSIEAMFIVGILLLIFLFVFLFVSVRRNNIAAWESHSEVRIICNDINEIITSVALKTGLSSSYILESNTTLNFKDKVLHIEDGSFFSCALPLSVTKGNSTEFSIGRGEHNFKNVDGKVVIE